MTDAGMQPDWKRLRRFALWQLALIVASFGVLVAVWLGVTRLERRRDAAAAELVRLQEEQNRLVEQLRAADTQLQGLRNAQAVAERELSTIRDRLKELQAKPNRELRATIDETLKATEEAQKIVRGAVPRKPRIYILYAGDGQRETAERLEVALQSAGYTVRKPTNIAGTSGRPATDMTQVRFTQPEDRASAREILSVLQRTGIGDSRISYVPDRQKTSVGRIEVWFQAGDVR